MLIVFPDGVFGMSRIQIPLHVFCKQTPCLVCLLVSRLQKHRHQAVLLPTRTQMTSLQAVYTALASQAGPTSRSRSWGMP